MTALETELERRSLLHHPAAPYVAPFAVFMLFLAIQDFNPLPQAADFTVRIVVVGAVIWFFSRGVLDFKLRYPLATIGIGLGVFALWVAPDALIPGYREHWLFHNRLVGAVKSSLHTGSTEDSFVLFLRTARAVFIVPIVEELFWRAWLMRWLVKPEFESVPLGAYQARAFWLVALLFAAEHGPYWDVGLAAGVVYNYWMVRTRSLGDLIWAHAITNAALCAYVLYTHKWEFWL